MCRGRSLSASVFRLAFFTAEDVRIFLDRTRSYQRRKKNKKQSVKKHGGKDRHSATPVSA
jgi:hypothetical protein